MGRNSCEYGNLKNRMKPTHKEKGDLRKRKQSFAFSPQDWWITSLGKWTTVFHQSCLPAWNKECMASPNLELYSVVEICNMYFHVTLLGWIAIWCLMQKSNMWWTFLSMFLWIFHWCWVSPWNSYLLSSQVSGKPCLGLRKKSGCIEKAIFSFSSAPELLVY